MFGLLRGLFSYRSFIATSIRNEFVSRFSRSSLGGLWMIINPLANVLIYALILSTCWLQSCQALITNTPMRFISWQARWPGACSPKSSIDA